MGKFDSVLDEVYNKQDTKLSSVLDEIYGPAVEPVTMVENEPTPIADMAVALNRGIESAGEAITSPIQKLFTAPPNQDVVVPAMPAEPGYVPPAGITDALRVAPGLALDATGQMISGAIQQAQEVAPSMINRAYERFANADLGGVLPPQMQQKVAPIINIPQEDIDTIAAVGQQAEENIKARLQEARIQPGLNAPNIVANAASSIIQQAPLFAGAALGGPVVGAAGLAAMGIGSMGARYQKARASGYKPEEAMLESGLYGLAEIIPEKLGMDAIFAAAKNPYAAKSLVEGIKRLMVATGLSMTAEGLEETATQLAQNTIRKYVRPDSERITEKPVESIVEGVPEAAVTGAVAGGAIGGSMNLINQIANRNNIEPEEPTATEPPPQNMEATTEFLTRKPTVTFGGEGERTGEAIPESKGMTVQPTAPTNKLDQLFKRESTTPQPKKEYGYLMNARPFSIGAQPKGQVRVNERTDGRYGTIYYDRPLTEQEMKSYELKPEGPIVYKDVTDNPFYNDIKDLKVIDTDKSADNILELTGSDKPIFLRNGKERIAVITPSAKQKGKFQATKFDERGPIGDAVSSTPKEAIKSLIEDGYKELSNEQEFTELTFDTKETQRQEVIRNINKPSTPSPERQQATEVAPKDITPQPAEPTAVKTPEVETTPEIGDTIQWNTPKVLGKTQTKTGTIVDKTADNRWTVSIDGQEFDFNPQKNTNIQVVEKYQQPAKTEQEQYVETRRTEISKEQKAKEEARQAEYPELKVEQKVETKPQTYIDKSVKDLPQKVVLNNGVIEIGHTQPKKYKGPSRYTITVEEFERAKKSSGNPEYGIRQLIKKKWFDLTQPTLEEEAVAERVVDSQISAIKKVLEQEPRPKSGPGMFGGATVQNMYEEIAPKVKKGADMLFKKGKQAYETVKRNADLTRDMGRVVDITEKEGRPVETEPPIRPRIGLFNLQNVYDAVFGKPKTSDDRITVGDPTIGKKINDMYDRTNKAEVKMKQEAESKRQTIGGAARQSLIDLFAPYLDIAKKDSATYEKALASLHDVFYIPSGVEAFLNNYRDQILSPIKKANKTYRDYSAYRMAKWTLTGRAKVKSPLSLKEAQDFVDSIDPQTRKLFEDITTDFHEKTWKPLLQEIEDSGLKDDKVIKFIMDKENYATFFPAKQMGLSYGSREYKPSGEIFKLTEEGFQGDIQDVLTSLMQKGIAMLTHANINMAKLTGIDILKTMSPKDIMPAKQSFKGYRKVKDTNGNEIEMPIMEFDEPAPNSQMALLTVRENGKAKGYYVPKQFAEAFDNALGDPSSFADSLRYYSNLTQTIKNVWIDYNPPWQLFTNMVRDIPAAAIEMPGFKKPIKFVGKVVKKAPAAIGDYVKFIGEVGQQITGYDRKAFEKQVTQLLKEKKLLSSKDVQHLGDYNITVFDRIQNAFDTFPKEGESQGFLQQLKAFGKDVERLTKVAFDETLQESGEFTQDEIKNMTRRGGSPAFGVRGGGKAFEVIKVPLMFYNAVKEGWRAGKYFYQKDPVGFLIKASVPLSIFSFGAAAATGAFGDEWKKAYLAIKKSDRENKLVYPLWWTDEGNIKYLALSVPQFLKPFMIMINELASSNPSLAEGLADAMSNEMPSLNPVLDITKTLTSYGGNKPPIDRFGNPIMTQDQWTAGGSEKALALLKSISNQNLFGSLFKFPVKPTDPKKDFVTSLYDATFGKIMKESFAPAIDTEEQDVNAAKARLLARQAIEAEESDPAEAERLREEMRKLGYTPSRQFMRSVRREMNIEREKKAGTITEKEAYEKRLRQQPKVKRKKYNELFRK